MNEPEPDRDICGLGYLKMPRPTKLTAQVQTQILLALKAGAYLNVAAASAGVSEATVHRWMRDGRAPYRAFRSAVEVAIAQGEIHLLGLLVQSAATNPGTAFKVLERRHPERWGRARAESPHPAPEALLESAPNPRERPASVLEAISPEWRHVIIRLIKVASSGRSPEDFFTDPDRLARLREDSEPLRPWWSLPEQASEIGADPPAGSEGAEDLAQPGKA